MFGFEKQKKRLRTWARKEIAREARATMVSYQAARQSLDIYEMRLETIDTRLGKRIRELEARIETLEATLALHSSEPEQHRKAG